MNSTFYLFGILLYLLAFYETSAKHDVDCVDEDGKEYKVGDVWTAPGFCIGRTCTLRSDGVYSISAIDCPLYKLPAGCHMSEANYTKPYPKCCPQPECPKKD